MTGNAALTEEMTRLLDEHPREARENRFSASLCGEMAVMRLLHNGTKKKMTAGELSSRLSMTTSRVAAVLGSLEKKGLLERENDAVDRRRVLVLSRNMVAEIIKTPWAPGLYPNKRRRSW